MSELKRVQLTTVDPPKPEKKPKRKAKTFRFVLSLGESNATTCPEYSFAELIKNEKPTGSDDPFEDGVDVAEVAAIAQRFEAKYGPKTAYSGKKKRTREMDDYYDLGDGYDIDDPFIDNTEAYDEVIPSTLTTKHGGFYINQGQLDFRSLSDDSFQAFTSPSTTPARKKKKKKGVLDSDSDEETPEVIAKMFKAKKRKKLLESKALEKKKKKLLDGADGEPVTKKKKKKNPQKLLKKHSRLKEMSRDGVVPSSPGAITTPTTTVVMSLPSTTNPVASILGSTNGMETVTSSQTTVAVPSSTITTTTSAVTQAVTTTTSTTLATSSAMQMVTNGGENVAAPGMDSEEKPLTSLPETMKEESSSKSGDEGRGEQQAGDKITQLPQQLPSDLLNSIESIKKCAKESTEGKCKFFSPEINKLLLEIEIGSYGLPWGSRSAIFGHLGDHLPCGKPALIRRAKKLRETQEEDQLREPIERLKKEINAVMPALQEQYRQELHLAKAKAEKSNSAEELKEEASTESEQETTATSKKIKRPKRIFRWTSELRRYLMDIVTIKMKGYKIFKSRNQTAEEYIKAFMDSDIRPLWPPGWMPTRILMKESSVFHEDLAKPGAVQQSKEKSAAPSGKAWPSLTPDTSSSSVAVASPRPPPQPHVSKTESVIEISSHGRKEVEGVSKDPGLRDVSGGGGDTVIVHLPGSSPSTASSTRPVGPPSSLPKLSPPPVEVIDITDSPLKPSPLKATMSQSLPAVDQVSIPQKQGQQSQPVKPVSKLQLQQSHQWVRQPRMTQPAQAQQQQFPRNVSTLGGLPLSQSSAAQAKSGDMLSSRWGSNLDPIYQAKVVLKPVAVSQGQQQKTVGSAKMPSQPTSSTNSIGGSGGGTSKSGNVQHGQSKPTHLTNPTLQLGSSKPPVSFSQTSSTVTSGQGGLGSSKQYSQPPPQRKPQAAAHIGSGSGRTPLSGSSFPRSTPQQQVRSGIVLGTSNSHPNARFPHSQAGGKTSNLMTYRPQQSSTGLAVGSARPDQSMLGSQGSNRSLQSGAGSSGSSKPQHSQIDRSAAIRTMQQGHSSPGSLSTPVTHLGSAITSPNSSRKLIQAEQPSPPSRGSNSCSPQQQLSPGDASAKLTLYEQIQSQIRSQEAMEGQALQNLALAFGFSGSKSARLDQPTTMPGSSPHSSREKAESARFSVVSVSDSPGLPHSHPANAKLSPSKLQENLLKLRDSMGGGTSGGGLVQNQHLAGAKAGKFGSGRSNAWQLPQPTTGQRTGSAQGISQPASVSTPRVEPQQPVSPKGQKNIFSEMQKSVHGTESLLQARSSSYQSSSSVIGRDIHKLNVSPENSALLREFGIDKWPMSKRGNFSAAHQTESPLFREGNPMSKSLLEVRKVVGSNNGDGAMGISHQEETKPPAWPEKMTGPTPHMPQNKGQGHSGSLSSK